MNIKKQQGFTLIELVMVIVILGILAATALPKFADMQNQARIATLNSALGVVNAAMAIAHSQALVTNQTGVTGSIKNEDGTSVTMAYGYPSTISEAINLSAADFTVTSNTIVLTASSTTDQATCKITYTPATSATVPATATIVATKC